MNTGVTVTTSVRTGPSNDAGPDSGRAFLVGVAERGPTNRAVSVGSIAEYETVFGQRQAYAGLLYDAARIFFAEGGSEAVIGRVVGDTPTTGFLVLKDRTGSPLDTARITALSAGAWSTRVGVAVEAGTLANTIKFRVYLDANNVESWDNVATVDELVSRLSASAYVRAEDLVAASSYPTRLPAIAAKTQLSAGGDDRATIDADNVLAAANALFGKDLGVGAVAAPGYPAATVGVGLIAHAAATNRIAILAGSPNDDKTTIKSTAATLAAGSNGDRAGLAYPWVVFPDGSGTRTAPPEAYVMAKRSIVHAELGFWTVPAGDVAAARFITGTVSVVDKLTNDELSNAKVSAIATIAGQLKTYGWFALTGDVEFELLSARDVLNVISSIIEAELEPIVWATIDGRGQVLSSVEGRLRGIMQPIADQGGFFAGIDPVTGDEIDPGYGVQVNVVNNPLQTLAKNMIVGGVAVRLSPHARAIEVAVEKAALNASVS